MYSFLTMLTWFLHGVLQKILVAIPAVKPMQESLSPPTWFMRWYSWSDWVYNLNWDRRPNDTFCNFYISAAWRHIREEFYAFTGSARDALRAFLLNYIGPIVGGWNSISAWIWSLVGLLGSLLPWWAADVMDALSKLWHWLPTGIRLGWLTWSVIWETIKQEVKNWALAFYYDTVQRALNVWQWLVNIGNTLTNWWQAVKDFLWQLTFNTYQVIASVLGAAWSFLRNFASNPVGYVLSYLAPWWQPLTTFARDCLTYWYNVWGAYAQRLADFLADPLGYIGDRAEMWMSTRLDRP